jgi:hypothetical protein
MKLSEILTGPETWCQGRYKTEDGRMCLEGAVAAIIGIDLGREYEVKTDELFAAHASPEMDRLRKVLECRAGEDIHVWNDVPERTWDEVAAVVEAYDRDRLLNP